MGIAIGATALSLVLVFIWLVSLSMRKKRLELERKAREVAYRKAIEKAKRQEKKERLFKAETGHIPTILFLAKEAERTNIKEALYWYEKAAQDDNINGMLGIVRISARKKEDLILKEQANYWKTAIKGLEGDQHAKFEMGKALVFGRGTTKNIPKGYGLIEESANAENLEAMIYMGEWSLSSDNSERSPEASTRWFKRAAKKDSVEGKIKLGLNYINGIGTAKNHKQGCYWLESAAEQCSEEAMFHAGEAWAEHGEHGNSIAYIWLFLSAHFGYEKAKFSRDKVGSNLGVDSVVGLQALAKPLMKKLGSNSVTKHSIIKALNKLYKRGVPLPKKVQDDKPEGTEEQVEALVIENSSTDVSSKESSTVETNKEQDTTNLDFSQSSVDPMRK
ncbi:sel1 repeat family protein [Vibrio makurazakiensis]|uniref:tetratricopeptide repeat protein n=1 Tax=Vibrio makurazakiensis TaxID=2910250 RepID=UPI003D0CC996